MLDKIYIQQSAIDRLSSEELLELLKDDRYTIQYGRFTSDIELQIKKYY